MVRIGYLPSGNSQGWGYMASNTARSTYIGKFEKAVWLRRISIRAGSYDVGTTSVSVFAHTGQTPQNFLFETSRRVVGRRLVDITGGENVSWDINGIGVAANVPICAGLTSTVMRTGYGQDNSGEMMFFNNSRFDLDPYDIDSQSPQGRIHIAIDAEENRKPDMPQVTSPKNGSTIGDTTPTITIVHSDPDLGYGDYFAKYKIEIWNSGNTSLLHTSGMKNTSSTEKSQNRASWTSPSLSPGTYTGRATTYDAMGVASTPRTWKFTISGGASEPGGGTSAGEPKIYVHPSEVVKTINENDPTSEYVLINNNRPQFEFQWDSDGPSTSSISIRVRTFTNVIEELLFGAPVVEYRSPYTWSQTISNGNRVTRNFPAGWASIQRGSPGPFVLESRVTDSQSNTTDWKTWGVFYVNPLPNITLTEPPAGSSHSVPPRLEMDWDVVNAHDGDVVTASFEVNAPGVSSTDYPATALDDNTFALQLNPGHVPNLGTVQWRGKAEDAHGLSTQTSWRSFNMVAPPAIDISSPSDGATLTVGDFSVEWTSDQSQEKYRVTVNEGSTVWYDSGVILSSSQSHHVPPGFLPNDIDIEVTVWVETPAGLIGEDSIDLTIDYTSPPALALVQFTPVRSSTYDRQAEALAEQLPNVEIRWAVATTPPSVDEWYAYGIEREDEATGDIIRWEVYDQAQLRFVDTSPASKKQYTYRVYSMWYVNDGAGIVKSEATESQVSVDIRHVVLRSESADDAAVTIHLWEAREVQRYSDAMVVRGWDELPLVKQGVAHDRNIRISATLMDHPEGWYTALDMLASLEELAGSKKQEDGTWRARVLNYSDPYGRAMRCVIRPPRVQDQHLRGRIEIELDIQEHR